MVDINTLNNLNRFRTLEKNWDSYGALSITDLAVDNAIKFLTELEEAYERINKEKYNVIPSTSELHSTLPYYVVPTQDGGVAMEWRREKRNKTLELDISPEGKTSFLIVFDHTDNSILEQYDNMINTVAILTILNFILHKQMYAQNV